MREGEGDADRSEAGGRRRLWRLVAGRLVVYLLLAGVSALWADPTAVAHGRVPQAGLVGLVLLLTLFSAAALRFTSVPVRTQAGAQLFCDVLLVTWLVWATGDLHSPYVALYIVITSAVSIILGTRAALASSVGAAFCYTAVIMLSATGWLPTETGSEVATLPLGKVVEAVGIYDIGILAVGLLGALLAERQSRSDVRLMEAAHALADLRALHERIVESIRSGVVTTDLQGRVYTINAAAEEMTGYGAQTLRGQDVSILLGDLRDQIRRSLDAAREGQTSPRFEADSLTAEGLRLRLGYSIFPLSSEGGETTGLVITFQDLTHVRAIEETARRQDRLAAVGRVAAGIAHEIRNPLAAMRGSIQVLQSEMEGDPAQAELMNIVLRESDRLNRIITDFLTYARPRPVSLSELDLREPLRETFALLRHSPELRDGHRLEEDLPEEPVLAPADAVRIKQAFWNLARNALTAMRDGGTLRAELRRSERGRARITFSDTGRGMTPEQVERLFEPFSSSTDGGTGLGLSIVYQIVRDHGGTINVRSREGHGTTITVELPASERGANGG